MMVKSPCDEMLGDSRELVALEDPQAGEMDAYERVLHDAMAGDGTLFARQDYVEEAWRIVDPVLNGSTPVYEYEPATWGPPQVEERIAPADGWDNPVTKTPVAVGTRAA
jgi:glucose-6-phosphate 1-dehydrogenase